MTPGRRLLLLVVLDLAILEAGIVYSPSYVFSSLSLGSKIVCTVGVVSWALLLVLAFASLRVRLAALGLRPLQWALALGVQLAWFTVLISWGLHARVASFLSPTTLSFVAHDPLHILALLTPYEARAVFLVLAASVALAAAAMWLTAPPSPLSGPRGRDASVAGGLVLLALATLQGFPRTALDDAERSVYARQVCHHATPGLTFLCSAVSGTPQDVQFAVALAPRYDGLERYLEKVPNPRPPARNLVIVVVESMRRDSLRALGADAAYMPFLDELASHSLLFSRAYSQSNVTHSSVAALLSSRFPLRFPVDSLRETGYPKTLIYDVLAALGYRTAIISSHNDRWAGMLDYLASPSLDEYFYSESYEGPSLLPKEDSGFFDAFLRGEVRKGSLDDRVTVDRFLEWTRKDPDRPFFAYLNFQATHFPYELAFDMDTPFRPNELDFPASFLSYPREKREVMLNRYRNSLRFVDARIRDVVQGVGGGRETLFVVTGDHGQSFFEHGTVTHAQGMFEEVVRVPLLVAGPGSVVPRRVDDRPIQGVDVLPTVLGLMGLPSHPDFQGTNVLDPDRDPDNHKLFLTTQGLEYEKVLIWRGFKLRSRHEQTLFFSLRDDPGETRDLLATHAATARQYDELLRQFVGTQFLYYSQPDYYRHSFPPRHE